MGLGVRLGSAQVIIASEPSYTPLEYFAITDGVITLFYPTGVEDNLPEVFNVVVPLSVTSIGMWAFDNRISIESVSMPSVTTVDDYAFSDCYGLTSISMPSVTTIDEGAFSNGTGLTSVFMPSVTIIGDEAFSGCYGLMSVSMPSVTGIGRGAFIGCTGLTSITIGAGATIESDNLGFETDYVAAGSLAGTYILTDGKWTLQ